MAFSRRFDRKFYIIKGILAQFQRKKETKPQKRLQKDFLKQQNNGTNEGDKKKDFKRL